MNFFATLFRGIAYCFIFLYELIKANISVAILTLKPRLNFKSAAVKYKSDMKTPLELIMITNSITLTPGTLVMGANITTGEIYVHVMSGDSVPQIVKDLKQFPEKKVLWVTRGDQTHG